MKILQRSFHANADIAAPELDQRRFELDSFLEPRRLATAVKDGFRFSSSIGELEPSEFLHLKLARLDVTSVSHQAHGSARQHGELGNLSRRFVTCEVQVRVGRGCLHGQVFSRSGGAKPNMAVAVLNGHEFLLVACAEESEGTGGPKEAGTSRDVAKRNGGLPGFAAAFHAQWQRSAFALHADLGILLECDVPFGRVDAH